MSENMKYIYSYSVGDSWENDTFYIETNMSDDKMSAIVKNFEEEMEEKYYEKYAEKIREVYSEEEVQTVKWFDLYRRNDSEIFGNILLEEGIINTYEVEYDCDEDDDEYREQIICLNINEIIMRVIKKYEPTFEWKDYELKTDGECFLTYYNIDS
jgi:hypothetical protein